jgi:hypothetical protein
MQARANASKPKPLVSDAKVLSPLPLSSICSFWVRMSRIGRSLSIEIVSGNHLCGDSFSFFVDGCGHTPIILESENILKYVVLLPELLTPDRRMKL